VREEKLEFSYRATVLRAKCVVFINEENQFNEKTYIYCRKIKINVQKAQELEKVTNSL